MLLEEMSIIEIEEYLKTKSTIILPFGSIEQHSYHLPAGTDTIIAQMLAVEVGIRTKSVVAPVIPIGFSPGLHTKFPGTISFKSQTYINLILDILDSIIKTGFKKILILTGHGLNISPIKTAVLEFLDKNDAHILLSGYWELEEVKPLLEKGDGTHCTIIETSLMLYLKSNLVDMNKAVSEYNISNYLVGKNEINIVSKSGVIADTTKSTKEKGEKYYKASINGLANLINKLENEPIIQKKNS